jgi:DivIVA domain-containing protein
MKKQFSTCMIGYNREEVDRYLNEIIKDYEEELRKKKDRMFELAEENRNLKLKNEELSQDIERIKDKEKYISRALIEAEQRAQVIIEEGQRKSRAELELLTLEKEKWRSKFREVRRELLEFEKILVNIIEKFRDEINHYAAKEISDTILIDEGSENNSAFGFTDSNELQYKLEETDAVSKDGMLSKGKNKEKVIA